MNKYYFHYWLNRCDKKTYLRVTRYCIVLIVYVYSQIESSELVKTLDGSSEHARLGQ